MAEYWKSAPKYWCKQCKIYIRDTTFEKTQHEATGKHQGNLKRFLRDIHRENERGQRDSQRAKNEVERLRDAVSGKAGDNPPWKNASSAFAPAAPAPAPARPVSKEERKKQMAQLSEMGVAIPDQYRGDMALAGDWQTVSEKVIQPEKEGKQSTLGVRKRKHDLDEEEEAKREAERFVSKGWGSATRHYPGSGAQEDEDLDALFASTKDSKKTKIATEQDASLKGEDGLSGELPTGEGSDRPPQLKIEESETGLPLPAVTNEPEEVAAGVVFKKRKPKAMRK
ncbi:hypothetical protein BDW59DRAFT_19741 [Aspergillus cavernicola]|uniref:U1-type domain-containing protein n=1 Tax=Aspergillus cavernicola TaxID=176166 RepID=A0ABR4HHC6_9EURO